MHEGKIFQKQKHLSKVYFSKKTLKNDVETKYCCLFKQNAVVFIYFPEKFVKQKKFISTKCSYLKIILNFTNGG